MLNDATCFKKIFIVTGYTDLRSGIDRLADTVRSYLGEDAIEPDTLYLFCGRRTDRIKGLVWENDGYLLLYKRLEAGKFQWPSTESEVRSITSQQFRWLMEGLTTLSKKQVKRLKKAPDIRYSFVHNVEILKVFYGRKKQAGFHIFSYI